MVGDTTIAPTRDKSCSLAGLPSIDTSTPSTIVKRGARRVPRWSSGPFAAAAGGASTTATAASTVACVCRDDDRDGSLSCATMRISQSLSDGSALIRLMSALPREVEANILFERDDVRPLTGNHVERTECLGIRERLGVRQILARLQDLKVFGSGDQNGRGHRSPV